MYIQYIPVTTFLGFIPTYMKHTCILTYAYVCIEKKKRKKERLIYQPLIYPSQLILLRLWGTGAYSSCLRVRGQVHPGPVTSQSQRQSTFHGKLCTQKSQPCLNRDSNYWPSRSKTAAFTAAPLCSPYTIIISRILLM